MNSCKQTPVSSLPFSLFRSLPLKNRRTRSYTTKKMVSVNWFTFVHCSLVDSIIVFLFYLEPKKHQCLQRFFHLKHRCFSSTNITPTREASKKVKRRNKYTSANIKTVKERLIYLNKFYSHCFSVAFSSFALIVLELHRHINVRKEHRVLFLMYNLYLLQLSK